MVVDLQFVSIRELEGLESTMEGKNVLAHFRGQARHVHKGLLTVLYNGCCGWWLMVWEGSKLMKAPLLECYN